MKTIFLLRHAKSSWDDVRLDDFDRPLSSRGIKSCKKMGKYLKKNRLIQYIVYCNSTIRSMSLKNHLRKIPELAFFIDDSLDYIDSVDDSINNPDNPIN